MASIYRIHCENCAQSGAEGKAKEIRVSSPSVSLISADGQEQKLRHPGEVRRVEAMGLNWKKTCAEGRLLRITPCICLKCGRLNENKELIRPAYTGCWHTLLLIVSVLVFLIYLALGSPQLWPVFGMVPNIIVSFRAKAADEEFSRKFADQIKEKRLKACVHCGNASFTPVGQIKLHQKTPCPTCGGLTQICEAVGIS